MNLATERYEELTRYDKPGQYKFLYRPYLRDREPPTIGIKFLCCNHGWWDELSNDIEKIGPAQWSMIKNYVLDIAWTHGNQPCDSGRISADLAERIDKMFGFSAMEKSNGNTHQDGSL